VGKKKKGGERPISQGKSRSLRARREKERNNVSIRVERKKKGRKEKGRVLGRESLSEKRRRGEGPANPNCRKRKRKGGAFRAPGRPPKKERGRRKIGEAAASTFSGEKRKGTRSLSKKFPRGTVGGEPVCEAQSEEEKGGLDGLKKRGPAPTGQRARWRKEFNPREEELFISKRRKEEELIVKIPSKEKG